MQPSPLPASSPHHSRSNSSSSASAPPAAAASVMTEANFQLLYAQIQLLTAQNQTLNTQVQQLSSSSSGSSSSFHQVHPVAAAAAAARPNYAPNKPPVFDGKMPLNQWIGAMDRWLFASRLPPDSAETVALCATFLTAPLGQWWDSVSGQVITWTAMQELLKKRWQPEVQSKLARAHLDNLKQRGSVSDYYSAFLSLMVQAEDMSEQEKIHSFKRGLHPRLREKLEMNDKEYVTVDAAMNAATLAEERRRHFMTTQFPPTGGRFNFQPRYAASAPVSTSSPMEISHLQAEPDFVDMWEDLTPPAAAAAAATPSTGVDSVASLKHLLNTMGFQPNNRRPGQQRLNKLSAEERQQLMREGKCFKCRKVGHRADSCPSSNKTTPTPQQPKN